MNEAVLAEVRAIGASTASPSGMHERDTVAARVAELLAGPDDPERRREFIRWAERSAVRAPTAEVRSAARLLLALVRDGASPKVLHTVDEPVRISVNPRPVLIVALVIAGLCAGGVMAARMVSTPTLAVSGPEGTAPIGPGQNGRILFTARGTPSLLARERWHLDGRDVTRFVEHRKAVDVFRPGHLDEGGHEITVTAGGSIFTATARKTFDFTIDLTPPFLDVPGPLRAPAWHPLRIAGKTDDGVRITVAGRSTPVEHGRFSISLPAPQPRVITIVATDVAGNTTSTQQPVTIEPRRPPVPIRAVHVSAAAWADPALRGPVLALIKSHRINTVELDIKDEGGIAGWNPPVALARTIGAAQPIYDLRSAVKKLHGMGVRVIGRVVCFRDPILATEAWHDGRRDEVVQTPTNHEYAGYGGFTNFANPVVRAYNIALSVAAARAGVDDILYDYVRRPDGPIASMRFPGLHSAPAKAIVDFLRQSRLALKPYGTFLGASVFGVAATRPSEVAQDVPQMARQVDYIAPLVYPSHWGRGEYNVTDPNAQPFEIVERSLFDFAHSVRGTPSRLVPWLQDFSLGVAYGPKEVRAQIDAARGQGIDEFILWNPGVIYTAAALDRTARPEVP